MPLGALPRDVTGTVDTPDLPGRVRVKLTRLVLGGVVRDRVTPPRLEGERRFVLDLSASVALTGDIDLPAPEARLDVTLPLGGALFDDVDFAVDFEACDGSSCPALLENLSDTPLTLTAEELP